MIGIASRASRQAVAAVTLGLASAMAWAGATLGLKPDIPQLELTPGSVTLPTYPNFYAPGEVIRSPLGAGGSARAGYLALALPDPKSAPGTGGPGPIRNDVAVPTALGDPLGAPGTGGGGPIRFPEAVASLITPGITEVRLRSITGEGSNPLLFGDSLAYFATYFPGVTVTAQLFTPGGTAGSVSYCTDKTSCNSVAATPDAANVLTAYYVGAFDWINYGGVGAGQYPDFEFLYSLVNADAMVYLDLSNIRRIGAGDTAAGLFLNGIDIDRPYYSIFEVGDYQAGSPDSFTSARDATDELAARFRAGSVPEPGTLALLASAMLASLAVGVRRRFAAARAR